ncbi:N-acetylglucosamine kinase [Fasciolopsis buskii]|uniref:N-acetylglucosamine kinase n=1 Tax=Fasciolopsis buskii TaxID=27845 RepID=A0A8E0S379_9TREM|nr:N-acetylglucosamine kinase [Fasciolopsis buski]
MALSGVDAPETILDLITALNAVKPELAKTIDICNDAIGTYLTASDEPAIVLICGTGSICTYIRKDLSCARIGGYGHLLGDGGSGEYVC